MNLPDSEIAIGYPELVISDTELYSSLGYRDFFPKEHALAIISNLKEEVSHICVPRLGIRVCEGAVRGNVLQIGQEFFHPGKIISDMLKNGNQYAIILASIGSQADEWIENYKKGDDIMKAFVADTLGSLIADAIVERAKEYLKEKALSENLMISNSYSPGYCGWSVQEQQALFHLLPEGLCGVQLLPSCLMLPIKSVSSIVAIGNNVKFLPYRCEICQKRNCYRRR